MMTRKHFTLIAEEIAAEADELRDLPYGRNKLRPLNSMARRLADRFERENPNFDRVRFLDACRVSLA